MRFKIKYFFLSLLVFTSEACAEPKNGNYSLRGSQQPGPLISLGGNIIDKNQAQLFLFADDYIGHDKYSIDFAPSFLYGITDSFSAYINYPIAVRFKDGKAHSSGLQDMFIQLEYSFYQNQNDSYGDQATVFGNMTFPTGSIDKIPSTGIGSPSFLMGGTFMRMYEDWFMFGAPSLILTTSRHETKYGNQYNYQIGIGRNIDGVKDEFITAWIVEVSGQYTEKAKIKGMTDQDSGGNLIYVVPSIWYSTPRLILQAGAGVAVSQHLFGNQKKARYLLLGNVGWTF